LRGSLSPQHTKPFANGGIPWIVWWRFSPGLLLTSGVGVVIVVFHPCARVPILKLCLSLLHSLITVAYSRLRECRSTLILPHLLVCVRNNPTLVATLRILWFIKPFTHQTILWMFAPGLLLTFGVGVVILVFVPRACVPFVKLCLSLLHSLITMAYSRLDELPSTLILFLTVLCVHDNPMLIAAWPCYPRYLGITRRSCLEAHMVLDMEYREQERPEHGPGGPIFFFSASFVLPAVPASITTGLGLYQKGLLLHEVIGLRYHGMCHI
jgi:hypothetical protein